MATRNSAGEMVVTLRADSKTLEKDIQRILSKSPEAKIDIAVPRGIEPAKLTAANNLLKKLHDSGQGAGVSIAGLGDQFQALVPSFSRALRVGGSLAASLSRLGLASIPLGTTIARLAGLSQAFAEAIPALNALGKLFPSIAAKFAGITLRALVTKGAIVAVAAAIGVALVQAVKTGITNLASLEDSFAQINVTLGNTGNIAGVTGEHILELARSLAESTKFTKGQVAEAAKIAVLFDNVRNTASEPIFDRALKDSTDLAERMGRSLPEAAQTLFQSLEDPATGFEKLADARIKFTEGEKETIKRMAELGDVAGAQAEILRIVEATFGDSAKAGLDTFGGAVASIGKELGSLSEEIAGPLFDALKPFIQDIHTIIEGLGAVIAIPLKVFLEGLAASFRVIATPLVAVSEAIKFLIDQFDKLSNDQGIKGKIFRAIVTGAEAAIGPLAELRNTTDDMAASDKDAATAAEKDAAAQRKLTEGLENRKKGEEGLAKAQNEAALARDKAEQSQINLDKAKIDSVRAVEDAAKAEEDYQHTLRGFPAASKEAVKATREAADAALDEKQAILAAQGARLDQEKAVRDLAEATRKAGGVTNGFAESSDEAKKATEDLQEAIEDTTNALLDLEKTQLDVADSQDELAKSQRRQAKTSLIFGANSRLTQKLNREVARSDLELRDKKNDVVDAQDEVNDSITEQAEAQRVAQGVLHGFNRDSKEFKEAQEALVEATQKKAEADLAIIASDLKVQESTQSRIEKETELQKILHGYGATSDEVKEAFRKMQDAQIAAAEAPIKARAAQDELTKALVEQKLKAEELTKTLEVLEAQQARMAAHVAGSSAALSGTAAGVAAGAGKSGSQRGAAGLLEAGNIDLSSIAQKSKDGKTSSVRSIAIPEDDHAVVIPTIGDDGRSLSDEQAIALYKRTKRHLGKFQSMATAIRFAQQLREHGSVASFATGGIVPGRLGAPTLAIVHGGEKITPPGRRRVGRSIGTPVQFVVDGRVFAEAMLPNTRASNRARRRGR